MSDPKPGMSPKQITSYAQATGRVNIFEGSIRAGKTFSWLLLLLFKIARAGKLGAIVIVGKNRDSIYRNVFEPIETIAAFAPFAKHVHYRQGSPTARIFGRMVHVIGANDAKAENKIRGMTIQLAFLDEVTILHIDFFKQLLGRMSVKGAQLFGTTNPDNPNHWLKKEYLDHIGQVDENGDDALPNWKRFHFTIDDNPSLEEEYKAALRREYVGLWFKRFILGLWVSADGAIYDMWDEDKHVIPHDQLPKMQRLVSLGIDVGANHPTAGTVIALGYDNRLYAVAEWAPGISTDSKLADSLDEWLPKIQEEFGSVLEGVYVDPAALSMKLELGERGYTVYNASNKVLPGIRTVSSLLGNDRLRISDRCTNLIGEFPGYVWDQKAADAGEDKPVKEHDDFLDSGRYSIQSSRFIWQHYMQDPIRELP